MTTRTKAIGGVVLLAMLALAVWGGRQLAAYAGIGGTYVAKQYCSCLFVTGRSEASCRAEFQPDIGKFKVAVDRSRMPASAAVTARLLMFQGRATYADGYGCTVAK
ncbi:hypothetical protein [Phenylobacterium montanum]|uniref:Amidase n=1 Tax=Phenylobacterium montanum TaxID=2823693 RepID=A0A975FXP4_9CAUL|nr:hypothetical protein [Caulobacter sp. S6]QUD86216.1 hypothetical protein KCG34_14020 [Caulobacter sp. S6]